MSIYHRFTDRARKVMQLANQEACRFQHEYIGTEHILLGLVQEGSGVAANVLKNLDIDLRKVRCEVEKIILPGPDIVESLKLPQTPRAKKVIDFAIDEARKLNHNYIGTEHLLLGLVREEEGVAAQVLVNLGVTLARVRQEVLSLLGFPVPDVEATGKPAQVVDHNDRFQDLPEPARRILQEFDVQLAFVQAQIEGAITAQDFDTAAALQVQGRKIKQARVDFLHVWRHAFPS